MSNETKYDITAAERRAWEMERDRLREEAAAASARLAAAEARGDRVTDLLPQPGEDRPMWIMRVVGSVLAWFRKPRSRIGWLLPVALAGLLASGCSTSGPKVLGTIGGGVAGFVVYHNYRVAESERAEKEMEREGIIPLRQSNADLIRSDPVGYALATLGGSAFGYGATAWAEDRAKGGDTVTTIHNDNRVTPPEPAPVDGGGNGGE